MGSFELSLMKYWEGLEVGKEGVEVLSHDVTGEGRFDGFTSLGSHFLCKGGILDIA